MINRHRGVDALRVAVIGRDLQPPLELEQRQGGWQVAVYLVGRAEDEGGTRTMTPRGLQQVQRPVRVDREVGVGIRRRPVMRGLGSGVDRSEERRVGKECRSGWAPCVEKKE